MIYSARPKPRKDVQHAAILSARKSTILQVGEVSSTRNLADPPETELAERIIARIEARLPGRIQHLTVYATDNAVVLTGKCSTFYTKQLAQHAAMGVLDYERLINNIDVRVAK